MTAYSHLTNDEIVQVLSLRDGLTDLENELLDRLILALDELARFEGGHTHGDNT